MADCTNCVVAIWSVLVPEEAVGAKGTPVNVGASVNASVLRVGLAELFVSKRLVPSNSTEPKTGVVKLTPVARRKGADDAVPVGNRTVPVNVGLARLALRSSAACCADETGLFASLVLFTLPRSTIEAVMPLTVPVNVGLARLALRASLPLSLLMAVRIVSVALIVPAAEE